MSPFSEISIQCEAVCVWEGCTVQHPHHLLLLLFAHNQLRQNEQDKRKTISVVKQLFHHQQQQHPLLTLEISSGSVQPTGKAQNIRENICQCFSFFYHFSLYAEVHLLGGEGGATRLASVYTHEDVATPKETSQRGEGGGVCVVVCIKFPFACALKRRGKHTPPPRHNSAQTSHEYWSEWNSQWAGLKRRERFK